MLTSILVIWLVTAIGLGLTTLIVPGIKIKSTTTLLIASIVLGLINTSIRPVLWVLTAPLSLLTFGLFALVINALMIMLASALLPNFEVCGFGSALLGAIIMALIGITGFILLQLFAGGTIEWYSIAQSSQFYY